MLEELGETMGGDSDGGSVWLCPLCQQGQLDRDGLALHLAEKHSVLPACLDKLLDIAAPKHCSVDEDGESGTQNDINGTSQQQCSENSPLMESQNEAMSSVTDHDSSSQEKELCDELGGVGNESDWSNMDSNQDNVTQSERSEASVSDDKSNDKSNAAVDDVNHPFKCHACLEFFPTRSALSVHYNSATHIQRMRTGTGNDSDSSTPVLARPYVSNKPYQCAVCRVSYNHAITLESHLKSVLHQSRSRNAGNAATNSTTNAGNVNVAANVAATTVANTTQLAFVTNSNCVTQASLTASQAITKDEEQVKPQSAPSLLSSPVASAQAVSAFLTLLTSSPNSAQHSILPSLFAAGTGTATGTATPQLITQPQMLMPLILNGLQPQSPSSESPKQLLHLGLSAAQQALLAQGLSGLQSQWAAVRLSNAAQIPSEENDNSADKEAGTKVKNEEPQQESCDQQVPQTSEETWNTIDASVKSAGIKVEVKQECNSLKHENKGVDDGMACNAKKQENDTIDMESIAEEGSLGTNAKRSSDANKDSAGQDLKCICSSSCLTESCQSPTHNAKNTVNISEVKRSPTKCNHSNTNLALMSSQNKSAKAHAILSSGPPILTEFQSQVLWAFIESRNEADTAIPPREDCEALGREVGLTEDEVRRWLVDARRAKERHSLEGMEHDEMEGSIEDDEGALMIDETEYGQSPSAASSHAMDLSNSSEKRKESVYSQNQGDLCLTSDSENEEFYTSVIVTDEESQSSSVKEEPSSPVKQPSQMEISVERSSGGGKVLRSTTVFLSDAEDEDEDQGTKNKKRKREMEKEESECKKERHDSDLDLQLEAQADPPNPLSVTVDHQGLSAGILHPLPLSLSLAPFSTSLFSPYVLSVPSSVVGVGVSEADRAKVAAFTTPPTITRTQAHFSDPLHGAAIGSLAQPTSFISNGSECESALDLSIGKSSAPATSFSANSKVSIQKTALLDGLGLRPTTVGVPADGSLIVVQVKPDTSITMPNSNTTVGNNNCLAKTSTVFMRAAEKVTASLKESEQEKSRDQKRTNARRFRDMRRSRTIIQADQLDVLYGCYFKDPNPGKHEFEQISEWVHLPKKVVQIWFQNMRARERKGEVRFISDGTLAAVGKPLIKFTWPLTKPIFSSTPKSNSSPTTPGWVPPKPQTGSDALKTEKLMEVKEQQKIPIPGLSRPKEVASTTTTNSTSTLKTKGEVVNAFTMVKIAPKAVAPLITVPILSSSSAIPQNPQNPKLEGQSEAGRTEEKDGQDQEKPIPGTTNRMVPKVSTTPINKASTVSTQKHNGINYWSQKGQIKINTLSREQLGLSSPRPITTATPSMTVTSPPSSQNQKEANYLQQHSTPRRPRTHLNCLQLSILQSCYETCAHPNALECEAVGTELGLPLKVVQIWFQNTRAKEKRWRLQQEKLSPNSSDPSKKVDISSGTYLQYNALRANRPILPKPVQLTVLESSQSSVGGQQAARETLRGKCEVCNVEFESRAAARDHVFSPRHLATLRTTNFGQSATQINNGSAGVMSQASTRSPAGGTS
ncbi:zinc finger homeobox protein 4 isoform X1 [Tachysurus fulvidraco]|uniref:zinc finger homeobox protein 4 isoform X1 n=2 Tax=Tachysurus fulvidraco TaxID=1234273 RepID=UPI000F4EFB20|nr:zinc finger homeobox protein 4 isoform X1 [Tachysurus fulvidraco]